MVSQLVLRLEVLQDLLGVLGGGQLLQEGGVSDPFPALGDHYDGSALLESPLSVVQSLLGLVQVHVHGIGSDGDHDVRLLGYGDGEDLVSPSDGAGESLVQVSGGDLVDVLVPVEDHLDGEDLLSLHGLQSIHHVLVDGIALESQGLGLHAHGELVVGLHGLEGGDSGQERLPSSGVSGEVVGLHGGDYNEPVSVHGDLVDLHRGAVLGGSQEHALGVLRIVAYDAVLELLAVRSEDEGVLLLGHVPVGSSGDEVPGGPQVHPLGQSVEDLGRRGGTGSVVHDEHDVLAALQELLQRLVADRVVDGLSYDGVRVPADDILGVERADVVGIRYVHFLDSVLAVLHVNHHSICPLNSALIIKVNVVKGKRTARTAESRNWESPKNMTESPKNP